MKTTLKVQAQDMLRAAHLYCTEARVAILRALLQSHTPLTQDLIASKVGQRYDKVTIYRTLASLLEAGLVHKALTGARTGQFESGRHCSEHQCHPHFTCTRCGSTHCLIGLEPPLTQGPYKGFVIQRQRVHFEGLCPGCV